MRRVDVAALADSARARWLAARALDAGAERKRDNRLLSRAISAYLHLLKMNEKLSDKKLLEIAQRTIDRIQFRGKLGFFFIKLVTKIYRLLYRLILDFILLDLVNHSLISFILKDFVSFP